jgi:uroporphyrinogen-III synthase
MVKHKVLSTKKLEPSLIEHANQKGIEIIEQEAIQIRPILTKEKWEELFHIIEDKKEFIVFTSSNAVFAVKKYLTDYINPFVTGWKIFCLSGKTKEALDEYLELFGSIIDTSENAKDLANKIITKEVSEVVFFCGNKRRDELPAVLNNAGIKVTEVVVYETIETPTAETKEMDAVLFFSPTAVESFFSVNELPEQTVCFAIGQTTAKSIADFTNNKIIVSELPRQETIIASVEFYFQNMNCYE